MNSPARMRVSARVVTSPGPDAAHLRIRVTSSAEIEIADLTDQISRFVTGARVRSGILAVHTLHTTTAVVLNEDEPLLRDDIRLQLERMAPRDQPYNHDDLSRRCVNLTSAERVNGHAHCRALLLGASISLGIVDGQMLLGRWQRILFVDLDGPQERQVMATLIGTGLPSSS